MVTVGRFAKFGGSLASVLAPLNLTVNTGAWQVLVTQIVLRQIARGSSSRLSRARPTSTNCTNRSYFNPPNLGA